MPDGSTSIGRALVAIGLLVAAIGVLVLIAERLPGLRIGRLPGDISVERGSFRFYFPLATSIVVSVVLTLALWLLRRR
jgi:hypothetical protein